ncbi:hypothetical protein [Psychroflexus sediminis]|uniref:Uncharacterized protein n=1 Tax=Psychroflexus sediminis TaxID=470826 RepID=A0A1G7X1B4_9FLAO|nr:hypothetical protein [Psychroflexus sediminis]SDG77984.1 hypothetical protein SAMN04488027_10723 [Psychroflexus sediminis]
MANTLFTSATLALELHKKHIYIIKCYQDKVPNGTKQHKTNAKILPENPKKTRRAEQSFQLLPLRHRQFFLVVIGIFKKSPVRDRIRVAKNNQEIQRASRYEI